MVRKKKPEKKNGLFSLYGGVGFERMHREGTEDLAPEANPRNEQTRLKWIRLFLLTSQLWA